MAYFAVILAVIVAFSWSGVSAQNHVTCERTFKKVGCVSVSNTVMTHLLVNDRDVTSDKYQGFMLNWKEFNKSIHSLACRCAAVASKQGFTYFGIRFFAECYGSKRQLDMTKVKLSNECIGPTFQECVNGRSDECVGKANSEYVYETSSASPAEAPSVNGAYSAWSEWGECTVSCGDNGEMSRERICNNPLPSGPQGRDCSALGPSTELKPCNRVLCPVDGGYSEWTSWSLCSRYCGDQGEQSRERSCNNPVPSGTGSKSCSRLGEPYETRPCNRQKCPVDGGYSEWTSWSSCSMSCGDQGEQSRERSCNNPEPSGVGSKDCTTLGQPKETRPCNREKCPVDGGYSEWTSWSSCSKSCGDQGEQSRERSCSNPAPSGVGSKDCTTLGQPKETRACNRVICPLPCPDMFGDYNGAVISMTDGSPRGKWMVVKRPDFQGLFTRQCQGEMTFPDDRKYTFSYDANICRIYWDGDKNHFWQKTCGERSFISKNYPLYVIGVNANDAYIMNGAPQSFEMISPGLNGRPGSISFRSKTLPDHFLRHQDSLLKLHPYENAQLYKDDATFFIRMDKFFPGFAAFESSNYPGYFLRHQNYRMMISALSADDLYRQDASFKISRDIDSPANAKKIVSYNYPDQGVGIGDGNLAYILKNAMQDFKIVSPGLNERRGSVSIMSASRPQFYLRHQDSLLKLHPFAFDQLYRDDATYFIRNDKFFPGFVSFESSNYPNHFLRHQNGQMKLAPYEDADLYRKDASFKLV